MQCSFDVGGSLCLGLRIPDCTVPKNRKYGIANVYRPPVWTVGLAGSCPADQTAECLSRTAGRLAALSAGRPVRSQIFPSQNWSVTFGGTRPRKVHSHHPAASEASSRTCCGTPTPGLTRVSTRNKSGSVTSQEQTHAVTGLRLKATDRTGGRVRGRPTLGLLPSGTIAANLQIKNERFHFVQTIRGSREVRAWPRVARRESATVRAVIGRTLSTA